MSATSTAWTWQGARSVARRLRLHFPPPARPPPRAPLVVAQLGIARPTTVTQGIGPTLSIAEAVACLAEAGPRDLLLIAPGGCLAEHAVRRLRTSAYASATIGSLAPLIVPHALLTDLNLLAQRDRARSLISMAWAGIAAIYLRHDCLTALDLDLRSLARDIGPLLSSLERAAEVGWQHAVAANALASKHTPPNKTASLPRTVGLDPVAIARRDLLARHWRGSAAPNGAVLLVTHDRGGGVEQVVRHRVARARIDGVRPILLRPAPNTRAADHERWCLVDDQQISDETDLAFRLPSEWVELASLLASQRPLRIELHHRLGHHSDILSLADRLNLPVDIWVHDYAMFCPQIDLVSTNERYCGEPLQSTVCTQCVRTLGSQLGETIGVRGLRKRSAQELAVARSVVVPTTDVGRRLIRQFANVGDLSQRLIIQPWDDISRQLQLGGRGADRAAGKKICVIGAITVDKGRDVLLACARDAAARALGLSFVLVGYSDDDAALLATGRVWVTGRYQETERNDLIRAQAADLAFLPSVWPETWSFALSHAWEAGLAVAVFDLGAPAERVRKAGPQSGFILPPNLPAAAINDRLLAAATCG